jgi:S1-C subfamily serine protease
VAQAEDLTHVPVAMPIDSESAGRGGAAVSQAVFRILYVPQNSGGTGFLHKSGKLITAAHVVKNCADVTVVLTNGSTLIAQVEATDPDYDLALLNPTAAIGATPLAISAQTNFGVGTQVTTWGFPSGLRP